MSPTKRPSAVNSMKRGLGTAAPAPELSNAIGQSPAEVPQRPRPEKDIRFTLDLDRSRHKFLKGYAAEIEAKGAADVLRALLDELQADPELAARVRARVWAQE